MSNFYSASQAAFRLKPATSGWVSQMAASGRSRQLYMAIALAMVANKMSDLPNGKLEGQGAQEYFLQQAGVSGAEVIGIINELMPVDHRAAASIAQNFYANRYENAFCPYTEFGANREKGLAAIFGLNCHFSEDVLDCMRKHGYEITNAYEYLLELVAQLRKE